MLQGALPLVVGGGGGGREVKDLGLGWDLPDKLTIPF